MVLRAPPIRQEFRGDTSNLDRALERARRGLERNRRATAANARGIKAANTQSSLFHATLIRLAGPAAAIAASAALTRTARSAAEYGQQLYDTSILSGITISDMQALARAGRDNGASFGQLRVALQASNRQIGEASRGIGEARLALSLLGLDARKLIREGRLQQLAIIFERISQLDTVAGRQFSLQKLFGEGGALIAPLAEQGAQGLADSLAQAEKAGELSAAQVKGLRDLNLEARSLTRELTNMIRQLVAIGADDIKDGIEGVREFIQRLRRTLAGDDIAVPSAERLVDSPDFNRATEALRKDAERSKEFFESLGGTVQEGVQTIRDTLKELREVEANLERQILEDFVRGGGGALALSLVIRIEPIFSIGDAALRRASQEAIADLRDRQRIARQAILEQNVDIDVFGGPGPSNRVDVGRAERAAAEAKLNRIRLEGARLLDAQIAGEQSILAIVADRERGLQDLLSQRRLEANLIFAATGQATLLRFQEQTRLALSQRLAKANQALATAQRDRARFQRENNLEALKGADDRIRRLNTELAVIQDQLAALGDLLAKHRELGNTIGATTDRNAKLKTIVDGGREAFIDFGKTAIFQFDRIDEAMASFLQRLAELIAEAAILRPLANAITAGIGNVLGIPGARGAGGSVGEVGPSVPEPPPDKGKGPRQALAVPNLAPPPPPGPISPVARAGRGVLGTSITFAPSFQSVGSDAATARRVFDENVPRMVQLMYEALRQSGRLPA